MFNFSFAIFNSPKPPHLVFHFNFQTLDDFGQVQPSVPPKYFLTFQGIRNQGLEGASYVRGNLEATLNASLNAPNAVRLPGGQQRPVENITRLPNDVYIAIANKAQRHKELRPVRVGLA